MMNYYKKITATLATGKTKMLIITSDSELNIDTPFLYVKNKDGLQHIINMAECQTITFEE